MNCDLALAPTAGAFYCGRFSKLWQLASCLQALLLHTWRPTTPCSRKRLHRALSAASATCRRFIYRQPRPAHRGGRKNYRQMPAPANTSYYSHAPSFPPRSFRRPAPQMTPFRTWAWPDIGPITHNGSRQHALSPRRCPALSDGRPILSATSSRVVTYRFAAHGGRTTLTRVGRAGKIFEIGGADDIRLASSLTFLTGGNSAGRAAAGPSWPASAGRPR